MPRVWRRCAKTPRSLYEGLSKGVPSRSARQKHRKVRLNAAGILRPTFTQLTYHTVMSALILIVEDEPQLAEVLEAYARQEGYRTERAADGNAALHAFRALNPDLILLDIMLPGRSGLDVLRTVRGDGAPPVILVTARAEETDQIVGLELGADDYVVKPFRPREVMARVRAVLRRAGAAPEDTERPVRVGPLEVDRRGFVARVDGEVLNLTPAEFRLLSQLAESPGRAFSREELLAAALPDSDALERVVDAHLASVRRKLDAVQAGGLLHTVRGVGYRLEASP